MEKCIVNKTKVVINDNRNKNWEHIIKSENDILLKQLGFIPKIKSKYIYFPFSVKKDNLVSKNDILEFIKKARKECKKRSITNPIAINVYNFGIELMAKINK